MLGAGDAKQSEKWETQVGTVAITTFFSQLPQEWFIHRTLRDGLVSQAHGFTPQKNSISRLTFSSLLPTIPHVIFPLVTMSLGICPNLPVLEEKEELMVDKNEHLLSSSHSVKMWVC